MPLANVERKDEIYPLGREKPENTEIQPERSEIVSPEIGKKTERDNIFPAGEIKSAGQDTTAVQSKLEAEKQTKSIKQLGTELAEIIDNVPQGGSVDMKRVEEECAKIVSSVMKDGDKSPEKIKDELIAFAENFNNRSSIGFIITELFKIADRKINTIGY